jgi:TPR repeat protein
VVNQEAGIDAAARCSLASLLIRTSDTLLGRSGILGARAKWREAADLGRAIAQNNLGRMYEKGHGVPQDYDEAVSWYRKEAEQGWAGAQSNFDLGRKTGHWA